MLKSELQTRITALHDASWYQAEFLDHFYCSLMSSRSAPFSLAVCIRRSWASLLLPRFTCELLPGIPGRNRYRRHGRHLYRISLNMSGTSGAPYNLWPRTPRRRRSKRVKSLQNSLKASLLSGKHRTATTSSFSTVSSRSLLSRDLFETRAEMFAISSQASFGRLKRHPPL